MPSAFFETPLASYLAWRKLDTVVITGGSTSGGVRATAVDSLSHGYRTLADRARLSGYGRIAADDLRQNGSTFDYAGASYPLVGR